ncbi:hypothetical protein Pelo_5106 [Pelomyxa schiedti]|nr:hypothetical protein Pelo_5106 [Pelomyxa schiedti]
MQAAVPVINGVLYLGCTAICKPFYVSDERVKWLRLCSERPANAECSSRCIKMVHMAPRNGVCKGKRVRVPDLFEVLPQCFDFIDSKVIGGDGAAKSPPTVITCDTGLNQSVVVVLAWMVIGMGWKLSAASTFLKQLVPQSAPFVEYLYRVSPLLQNACILTWYL